MISLTELKRAMPSDIEFSFADGVVVIAELISIDEDVDCDQIFYKPLKVLRAPVDSVVKLGRFISVSASDVVSWCAYTGPRDWETRFGDGNSTTDDHHSQQG